jgi:hypothetical protein
MVDAARLADELRGEQQNKILVRLMKRNEIFLNARLRTFSSALMMLKLMPLKEERKPFIRWTQGFVSLSLNLMLKNHRFGDALKNLRKSERRIKELTFIKLNLLSKECLFCFKYNIFVEQRKDNLKHKITRPAWAGFKTAEEGRTKIM